VAVGPTCQFILYVLSPLFLPHLLSLSRALQRPATSSATIVSPAPPSPRPRARPRAALAVEPRAVELARRTDGAPRGAGGTRGRRSWPPRPRSLRGRGGVEREGAPQNLHSRIHGRPWPQNLHPGQELPELNPPPPLSLPMPSDSKTVVGIPSQRSSSELQAPPMAAELELAQPTAAEAELHLAPLAALAWRGARARRTRSTCNHKVCYPRPWQSRRRDENTAHTLVQHQQLLHA
jgi:hypothetical protein